MPHLIGIYREEDREIIIDALIVYYSLMEKRLEDEELDEDMKNIIIRQQKSTAELVDRFIASKG